MSEDIMRSRLWAWTWDFGKANIKMWNCLGCVGGMLKEIYSCQAMKGLSKNILELSKKNLGPNKSGNALIKSNKNALRLPIACDR